MTLFDVIDATWPAASVHRAGGFLVREGKGGGSRVSCASRESADADPDAAIAVQRALGQAPLFMIRPGDDALDAALAERGMTVFDPVVTYSAPLSALSTEVRPVTAFSHWPPLAITRGIWQAAGIGPGRMAVMDRVTGPRTAILGRINDRAAGAAFVALHGTTAMLHALAVLPDFRRQGLAAWIMAEAARWAATQNARDLALVVTQANGPGNALYHRLGMTPGLHYHYRREVPA